VGATGDASGERDVAAEQVAVPGHRLADVNADADADGRLSQPAGARG
jgi:hypothetical protein